MNTDRQRAMLHYSLTLVRKHRGVDKKGVVVALIFLIAISLWAGWRRDKTIEHVMAWYEQPNLSAEMEIRPVAKTEALHDPRQER